MLDRAQSDPQWKQQLLDDPEAAMRTANFPETQQFQRMQAGASQEGEVRGQWWAAGSGDGGSRCNWTWYCVAWTWRWENDEWD